MAAGWKKRITIVFWHAWTCLVLYLSYSIAHCSGWILNGQIWNLWNVPYILTRKSRVLHIVTSFRWKFTSGQPTLLFSNQWSRKLVMCLAQKGCGGVELLSLSCQSEWLWARVYGAFSRIVIIHKQHFVKIRVSLRKHVLVFIRLGR